MDSKTKINLLVAAVICLTISLIVSGVVVVVLVKGGNQQVIQDSAEKSVIDMAAAMKRNTLEAEARAEERKKEEAKAKEWSDIMAKNRATMDAVYKK